MAKNSCFMVVTILLLFMGVGLSGCPTNYNTPSSPLPPVATSTLVPTATPTLSLTARTATCTPTPTSTSVYTLTLTPSATLTVSPASTATNTPSPTVSVSPSQSPSPTPTGCASKYFALQSVTNPASAGTTMVGLSGMYDSLQFPCLTSYISSIIFNISTTGNLNTEIQQIQLWQGSTLVASSGFMNPVTFSGSPLLSNTNFSLQFVLSPIASGVVETTVPPGNVSGYSASGFQVMPPQADSGPLTVVAGGSSTPTNSPTVTPTLTTSSTPTPTPTATTGCTNNGIFGDQVAAVSTVTIAGDLTHLQEYTLAQNSMVQTISLDPVGSVVVQVGVYSDWNGLYPNNLLCVSGPATLNGGIAAIPVPNVVLAAGTYWLALGVVSGSADFYAASGSTAVMVDNNADFPSPWAPCLSGVENSTPIPTCTMIPRFTTNQVVLYAGYCY
jgi:hypothetical protein